MTFANESLMTACQVITWIAFGTPMRKEELGSLGLETVDTGAEDKDRRYEIRTVAAAGEWDIADLDRAEEQLRNAVSGERLVAFGIHKAVRSHSHDPIPFSIFMSRGDRFGEHSALSRQMMFTWWDTIESEGAPESYSDVQFKTTEVLAIWPASNPAPPELLPRGAPGRPSNMNIIDAEFRRRTAEGLLLPRIGQEAAQLHLWFRDHYPTSDAPTPKTISNHIREPYRNRLSR